MNEMQTASMLTLYMILFTAVIQDFMCMKISNRLILMGLFCSIAFGISIGGVPQIIYILWNISFPVIILYLLYVLGILGAGDIKLFSVIGGFTNFKTLTDCILAALLVGAIISVGKMLHNRNLQFSLFKGSVFIRELLHGNFMSYRKSMVQKENLMHFFGGNSFGVYGGESSNVYVADTVGKEKL